MAHMNDIMRNPFRPYVWLSSLGMCRFVPDEMHLKLLYRGTMGRFPNLENPQTFNEKLQWLKLHDRNPLYTTLVDKYAVKEWATKKIGEKYIVPTYGVWESFRDIDFDSLPDQFVLKCTHDSGSVAICRNKDSFDYNAACKKLTKGLKKNFYWSSREWPYKHVRPRIIAEKYIELANGADDLPDYKYFCFSGKAKAMFVATNRFGEGETRFDFYDMRFRHLPFTNGHPNAEYRPAKPKAFDEMRELAEKLSEGIPHVRVDFYESDEGIYFGEMTFSHWGGLVPFEPPEWDERFGKWIELPRGGYS